MKYSFTIREDTVEIDRDSTLTMRGVTMKADQKIHRPRVCLAVLIYEGNDISPVTTIPMKDDKIMDFYNKLKKLVAKDEPLHIDIEGTLAFHESQE